MLVYKDAEEASPVPTPAAALASAAALAVVEAPCSEMGLLMKGGAKDLVERFKAPPSAELALTEEDLGVELLGMKGEEEPVELDPLAVEAGILVISTRSTAGDARSSELLVEPGRFRSMVRQEGMAGGVDSPEELDTLAKCA